MTYQLFPVPRKMSDSSQQADLRNAQWVVVDPRFSAILKKHLVNFCRCAQRLVNGPLMLTAGNPAKGAIFLSIRLIPNRHQPQGYTLTCRETGLFLDASDEAGAFYGLQTLRQIVHQSGNHINIFSISDYPDFPNRGFMLDISRCKVPTMETLFKYVEILSRLKINQFQLYTEHTFAYSAHEAVWHDASPMTPAQILELDAYCRQHYIELVPNQNSFGHFERWLRHPEYFKYAECPDGFTYPWNPNAKSAWGSVLKPNNESINLLDSLYQELLPNFSSRQLNVGCDETWELGNGWSKPQCDKRGKVRVYADHLLKIHRLVKKHHHRMMFWGDIILHQPNLIKELPRDIIALNWGYEANHPFEKEGKCFSQSKIPYYVCPGTSSWCSLTGRTLNAIENCRNAALSGIKHGAIGYLNTDWGDGGHHQYLPVGYTGMLAGAGVSWCLKSNQKADLAGALNRILFRDKTGVTGRLFYDLGRVLELAPVRPSNNTIFNALLFWDEPLKRAKGLKPDHLRKCIDRFDELENSIALGRPDVPDARIIQEELANAIAMARFACCRGLMIMKDKKAPSKKDLRHKLQHVIRKHEELWLYRNRPGGLNESSGILRKKLAQLV